MSIFLLGCSTTAHIGTVDDVTYEWVPHWPGDAAVAHMGQPAGLGIDRDGNILVFHRAGVSTSPVPQVLIPRPTILKLDAETGAVIGEWGAQRFLVPHGLNVDASGNIWVTDVGLHQVFKFSANGELLLHFGVAREPGNDSLHFDRPTDVAVASDGSFYVSDGYGNSRIIKFAPNGKYIFEWGKKGRNPGEFDLPHAIDTDGDGNVLVADRQNMRIQKFDASGQFMNEWKNQTGAEVYAVSVNQKSNKVFLVDYLVANDSILGSDVSCLRHDFRRIRQFGRSGSYGGPVCRYHDIETDVDGNIYVADLLNQRVQKFKVVRNREPQ